MPQRYGRSVLVAARLRSSVAGLLHQHRQRHRPKTPSTCSAASASPPSAAPWPTATSNPSRRVPGMGRKTAEHIVVELKDKVGAAGALGSRQRAARPFTRRPACTTGAHPGPDGPRLQAARSARFHPQSANLARCPGHRWGLVAPA